MELITKQEQTVTGTSKCDLSLHLFWRILGVVSMAIFEQAAWGFQMNYITKRTPSNGEEGKQPPSLRYSGPD